MADALALFDARRSKWTNPDGTLTQPAQLFIRGLWLRGGGPVVDSGADLGSVSAVANEALSRSVLASPQPVAAFGNAQPINETRVFAMRVDQQAKPFNDSERVIASRVFAA